MKTVGELKRYIEGLPDDTLLVKFHSDMERYGYINGLTCNLETMEKEIKHTYDRFDYTEYDYEVYAPAENGQLCLRIH
jgi:hypothetical protein